MGRPYKRFYEDQKESDKRLSSQSYVPAVLKENGHRFKLQIANPHLCDHETTICIGRPKPDNSLASLIKSGITCMEAWELDHEILYERTAGGRRIRDAATQDL